MGSKKYRIKTVCPQCGCSAVQSLSDKEIEERFGDAPNVHVECSECMLMYENEMKDACPEWDDECRLKQKG
jgi:hypothetical protein